MSGDPDQDSENNLIYLLIGLAFVAAALVMGLVVFAQWQQVLCDFLVC
jgi:hypothetical protein